MFVFGYVNHSPRLVPYQMSRLRQAKLILGNTIWKCSNKILELRRLRIRYWTPQRQFETVCSNIHWPLQPEVLYAQNGYRISRKRTVGSANFPGKVTLPYLTFITPNALWGFLNTLDQRSLSKPIFISILF